MRLPYDSLEVPLPPAIKKAVDTAICEDCRRTVQANSNRDQDLFLLRQQLEGVSQPAGNPAHPNSCLLEDCLPRELHTTALANVCAAFRQKPYFTYESLSPDHDAQVSRLEILANSEFQLFGFDAALATLAYIALEGRYAVCCVEYRTTQTKRKELRDVQTPEGEEEGAEEQQQELWQVNEVTEQFEFRSVDPWDFYLSPVGSQKVDRADRVYERVWMSRTSLLDGVRNEGFDAEAVDELLKAGPTAVREGFSPRTEQMLLEGVQEDVPGFFECYKGVGRMPYVLDQQGNQIVPEQFLEEDYVWYFCPERNIVFKHTYRPYSVRPYATGHALGPEDRLVGHGIVSAVSAIADELTIMLRAVIDSVNFNLDPQVKVPEGQMGWYSQKDIRGAGRFLPYRGPDPNVIQEVHRDFNGLQMGIELGNILYGRAQRMVAAEGINAMGAGKVYKAAQVEFTEQVMQNKFGLIVFNLQPLVADIARIYMAIRKHTLPQGYSIRMGDTMQDIQKEEFDIPYRIIPHADPDNASSQARLQRDFALLKLVTESPLYQQMIAMGNYEADWLIRTMIASHMGVQNPQAYFGPIPAKFDAEGLLRSILPIVLQGAQQGDPVAQAIIQMVQQRQMQAAQSAQSGQSGGAPQGYVSPGLGLNLPALPSRQSTAQGAFGGNGAG